MKRRHFLKSAVLGAGAVGLTSFPYHLYAGTKRKYAHDRVMLGNSGVEVSRVAMGTGTRGFGESSNQTRKLGIKGLSDLLVAAYDEGITFWDTADQYGSHPHVREALKRVPREKVVILTKTNANTAAEAREALDRFRTELGTDYFDIVLLHARTSPDWSTELEGPKEVLSQAKEDGIIKMHGISCHSIGALRAAAADPWVDIDLARFNPGGVAMDDDVDTVRDILAQMAADGKSVMGMKVLGAGRLADKKDECLQFHLAHEFISTFTLGFESYEQFKDLQKRIPEASVRG